MFNLQHILYMTISGALTAVLIYLFVRLLKNEKSKTLVLRAVGILTVLVHYSDLLVEYITEGGEATISSTHILPMYPCNVIMWLFLILSFIEKRDSVVFRVLSEFCFLGGTVCMIVGIVFNANFDSTPTLLDYSVLKGLLSHSVLLVGCLYLFFGGFIKIGAFNSVSVFFGLLTFVICGAFVNILFSAYGLEITDGFYLIEIPGTGISSVIPGTLLVLLMLGIYSLFELRLPKDERWYAKIKKFLYKKEK